VRPEKVSKPVLMLVLVLVLVVQHEEVGHRLLADASIPLESRLPFDGGRKGWGLFSALLSQHTHHQITSATMHHPSFQERHACPTI
jgi:hypothetical protein